MARWLLAGCNQARFHLCAIIGTQDDIIY